MHTLVYEPKLQPPWLNKSDQPVIIRQNVMLPIFSFDSMMLPISKHKKNKKIIWLNLKDKTRQTHRSNQIIRLIREQVHLLNKIIVAPILNLSNHEYHQFLLLYKPRMKVLWKGTLLVHCIQSHWPLLSAVHQPGDFK